MLKTNLGRMGIGLCEYRVAIGAFAWIAVNAGLHWQSKFRKKKKSSRLRTVGETKERCKKEMSANPSQLKKRWMSVDRCKTRSRSKTVGRRSKTLNQREHRERSCYEQPAFRMRSQSHVKRRKKLPDAIVHAFKNSCITCKTEMFSEKWQRGRSRKKLRRQCKETQCNEYFSHVGEGLTNLMKDVITPKKLHFLASVAISGCLLLEQAIFTIVQMLLARAGIETNPGPTNPTSSPCCNAYQHFKRVTNTIEKAQDNFQSKATQDTLTKKVIEISETSKYFSFFISGKT